MKLTIEFSDDPKSKSLETCLKAMAKEGCVARDSSGQIVRWDEATKSVWWNADEDACKRFGATILLDGNADLFRSLFPRADPSDFADTIRAMEAKPCP